MVVNEDAEESLVGPDVGGLVVTLDVVHGTTGLEYASDGVVHRIVQDAAKGALVTSTIVDISVKDLSDGINSCRLGVLRPEGSRDFGDSVDSEPVETVVGNNLVCPLEKGVGGGLVLLVEIRKSGKSAIFNLVLVIPVTDLAVGMVVAGAVEGVDLAEIVADRSDVVGNHIEHDPHAGVVVGLNEFLEIGDGTEVGVDVVPLSGPISVIASWVVDWDWRDPDSIEAHALDVRNVVDESSEGSAAVI